MKTLKFEKLEQKPQQGFSMIEVLVTLVLVAITMLGAAGLQVYAMKQNQGSSYRTQAILLSTDMAERIEANKIAATRGQYALASGVVAAPTVDLIPAKNCNTAPCTSAQLAVFDLAMWRNQISNTFPAGSGWEITCPAANPATCKISVSWVDRRTANSDYSTTGTNEAFTYPLSRTYWVLP